MKRLFLPLGLLAALALPATATAAPTKADKGEGAKECRQLLRTVETRANFVQIVKLEARANRKNAFGRCVKVRAAEATAERNTAFKAAKAACATQKRAPGTKGKPANPGAYGQCVSAAAHALNAVADAEQREEALNPARTCRGRQEADAETFKLAYPGKNGFGKCVSEEARKQDEATQTPA